MTLAVAVTAPRRIVDGRERVTLNTTYVRALEGAGLVPLAVQWHPEDLTERALFDGFARAVV